jgi:hypothetical protein
MATARTITELRRWADLALIHRAFEARMPDFDGANAGLKEVAELCRRDYTARPGRDWNWVRDQLLTIGTDCGAAGHGWPLWRCLGFGVLRS